LSIEATGPDYIPKQVWEEVTTVESVYDPAWSTEVEAAIPYSVNLSVTYLTGLTLTIIIGSVLVSLWREFLRH